ncbi:cytochrome P450 2E1-like isoform X2 [Mercenaria mercenaria]|uniref:cytochrome P450 2E1-like isoform X2 n=1 Tax=Mercenaria mercenaria TaxID=6596 RepID=UPI00234EDA92|nr:cytochrome P450 2E1-like isoform X2 [Mercenaria mercenaria]
MIQLVLCFIIGVCSLYKLVQWRNEKTGKNIPGPHGLPLIGCANEVRADNIHLKLMEYAEQYGEIFQLKMLVKNFIVLNSESILRLAFSDEHYKQYFNDRAQMFFGHHFRCRNQSIGMISDGAGKGHKIGRKEFAKAIHAYGSGLQKLEDNVMTEMELLVKRIERMPGNEFQCLELFRRSLTNTMSLVLNGDVIDDNDPNIEMMWQHVQGADFFLNSKVNLLMKVLPFLRFLPGKLRAEYESCKKAQGHILQRYFYETKKSHVSGVIRGIVDHYLDVQSKEIESGNEVFFTDERIIAQIIETIDAGTATTWSFLTNSMLVLVNLPEYQTKIQEELDRVIGRERLPNYTDRGKCTFLKAFCMEVLRYLTVAPLLLPHYCRKNLVFEGYNIKSNSMLFTIWPWSTTVSRVSVRKDTIFPLLSHSVTTLEFRDPEWQKEGM